MNVKRLLITAALMASTCAGESAPPIACNMKALTSPQRKQLMQLGEHIIAAIDFSRELKDGYTFHVNPAKASLKEVAEWLDVWRRCCPFYEFQIDFHAADASLWLAVRGRPGVKEYIPLDSPLLATKLPK